MTINRVPRGVPTGGEFAEGRRAESATATLDFVGIGPTAADLRHLPYLVPDLTADQQAETGLPADFERAYHAYFAEADAAMERHDGDAEAAAAELITERDEHLVALERSFPGADGPIMASAPRRADDIGWYLDRAQSDGATTAITYSYAERDGDGYGDTYQTDGPTLTTKGAKAREHAAAVREAEDQAGRVRLLSDIRADREAPWAFLPATGIQDVRASNVGEQQRQKIREIKRRQEARDRLKRAESLTARYDGVADEDVEETIRAEYKPQEYQPRGPFGESWGGKRQGWVSWREKASDGTVLSVLNEGYLDSEVEKQAGSLRGNRAEAQRLRAEQADWPQCRR